MKERFCPVERQERSISRVRYTCSTAAFRGPHSARPAAQARVAAGQHVRCADAQLEGGHRPGRELRDLRAAAALVPHDLLPEARGHVLNSSRSASLATKYKKIRYLATDRYRYRYRIGIGIGIVNGSVGLLPELS